MLFRSSEEKKNPNVVQGRQLNVGAVASGGIEWKYNPNLSLRLEGLYYFFDDKSTSTVIDTKNGKVKSTLTYGLNDIGVVRVGANWHF